MALLEEIRTIKGFLHVPGNGGASAERILVLARGFESMSGGGGT